MPLYDVTHKKAVWVDPDEAEEFKHIQALVRKLPKVTFDRIVKSVDEAIASVKPSETSKLVWTCMAALFGRQNMQPSKRIDHIWENVIKAVGADKECQIAIGSLLWWRVSLREEIYLVFRRELGSIDPLTGKEITRSEYWIKEDYVFEGSTRRPAKTVDVSRLAKSWGARF